MAKYFLEDPTPFQPGFVSGRAFEIPDGEKPERADDRFMASQMARCRFLGPYYLCQGDCNANVLEWGDDGGSRMLIGKEDEDFEGRKSVLLMRQICPSCWKAGKRRLWEQDQAERHQHLEKYHNPSNNIGAREANEQMAEQFEEAEG